MTIPVNVSGLMFATNGATKAFNLTSEDGALYFYLPSDLTAAWVSADGLTVIRLHYNNDFSVGGNGRDGTGVLTTLADDALADGGTLTIWRGTGVIQPENYLENDSFPSGTHNNAQDRGRLIDQDLARAIALCFGVPNYETAPAPVPRRAQRLDRLALFDAETGDMTVTDITWTELLTMLANGAGNGGVPRGYRNITGDIPGTQHILPTDHFKSIYIDNALGDVPFTFDAAACDGVITTLYRADSEENPHTTTMNGTDFLTRNNQSVVVQIANGELRELARK